MVAILICVKETLALTIISEYSRRILIELMGNDETMFLRVFRRSSQRIGGVISPQTIQLRMQFQELNLRRELDDSLAGESP